jgi:hypothetical protein
VTAWRSFVLALVLPVLFTAVVLIDVQRNRLGAREPIALTQREVALSSVSDKNSGMSARVNWSVDQESGRRWLSLERIRSLGFDVSERPVNAASRRDGARQLPRRAYVVFELQEQPPPRSRLVPIDASANRDELLAQYPNGRTHLITAAVVGVTPDNAPGASQGVDAYLASVDPVAIHVPAEFAASLRNRTRRAAFTVLVRYGSRLEPWIAGVR